MKKFLLCIPLLTLLCGCWDYREPNMEEYVLGIGIDLTEEGSCRLTVETADLSASPEEGVKSRTLTAEGINLFDAIQNASVRSGKQLYWGHLDIIVIDKNVTGAQLHAALDLINRTPDVYQSTMILVSLASSAREVFESEPAGASSVTEHCLNVLENRAASRRLKAPALWEYTRMLSQKGGVVLPSVTVSGETLSIDGGVVYRATDRLAALTGEEMLALPLLTESDSGGFLSGIELSPDHTVSLEILSNHVSNTENEISVTLSVSVSSANFYLDLQNNNIEAAVSEILQKNLSAFIARAEREGFSFLLDLPPSAPPRVNVSARLHHAGMYHDHPEDVT